MKSEMYLSAQVMEGLDRIGRMDINLQTACTNTLMISSGLHPAVPTSVSPMYSDLDVFRRVAKGTLWAQVMDWREALDELYPSIDTSDFMCTTEPVCFN